VCKTLRLVGKLKSSRSFTGSPAMPAHATATAMHFPANAGLIFLTDYLNNDRYLVDNGATLSIIPCPSSTSPSGPLLKGVNGLPIYLLLGIHHKNCPVSRQTFYFQFFCEQLLLVPFWALIS
jgi:hypothetical protein